MSSIYTKYLLQLSSGIFLWHKEAQRGPKMKMSMRSRSPQTPDTVTWPYSWFFITFGPQTYSQSLIFIYDIFNYTNMDCYIFNTFPRMEFFWMMCKEIVEFFLFFESHLITWHCLNININNLNANTTTLPQPHHNHNNHSSEQLPPSP